MKENELENTCLSATAEVVSSYLLNHKVNMTELEEVIDCVYHAFERLEGVHGAGVQQTMNHAGVSVEESVTDDYIVCLEDGKRLKMLKRYLRNNYNMTPEEYRKRWGLPANYPMVAPNYAAKRSQLAKDIGLGKQTAASKSPAKRMKIANPKVEKLSNELPSGDLKIISSMDVMRARAI
jgi:predicted transcriptional regulator